MKNAACASVAKCRMPHAHMRETLAALTHARSRRFRNRAPEDQRGQPARGWVDWLATISESYSVFSRWPLVEVTSFVNRAFKHHSSRIRIR